MSSRPPVTVRRSPPAGGASPAGGAVEDPNARRKDAKRQRREAQLAARAQLEARERRRRLLMFLGGLVAGLALLVWLGWWIFGPRSGPQVQTVPILGRDHIARNQTHPPYNTKPPTSGWHYGDAVAPWGVSRDPIADEVQVHNLEHGGIMVQYDCPESCPDIVNRLENIGRSYASKVIVAPYPGIGRPIALTAWGRIAYLDDVDEGFIRNFIDRNKDKGPEFVSD